MSRRIGIALLFLCTAATPGGAAEDGGTQSVFALGAGNRALGMGGAFVASSADASSMFWNPAGLGLVQRAELQFTQSGDLAFGASESYAGLVLPSWRWGTVGLTVRHFGVGGVEARDDRNLATGATLDDSEIEMALGYGRRLGPWWSIGGAAKFQRQTLAGFSAGAAGLDLGLSVVPFAAAGLQTEWAQDWTLAFSARNVIEPSLRLDVENVPDPTALRTGVAWQRPLWGADHLVAEIDVEKSRNTGARFRTGLEYGYRGSAVIRLGVNDSHLAAGTSLRWRDLSLDYAYQDGALETTHRVGLSVPFGGTTAQAETRATQIQDEALAQRLAAAFQHEQEARIAALIAAARDDLRAGRFEEALLQAAMLRTLDPARPEILAIEIEVPLRQAGDLEQQKEFAAAAVSYDRVLALAPGHAEAAAGAARCRAASDALASRDDALRQTFASGMDALSRADYAAARTDFRTVLLARADDDDARKMLAFAEASLQREAKRQLDEADQLIQSGRLDEAEAALQRARSLSADPLEIDRLRGLVGRARRAHPTPVAPPKPSAPTMEEREAEDLYKHGLAALRESRSEDAVRYLELVWGSRPGYRQVADLLKREYLARGLESFAAGRIESAMRDWSRVLEIDPNDVRARGYLERARQQSNRNREILGDSRQATP